jgi:hypothetical protein
MPDLLRTRLTEIEPPAVHLTVAGGARVRVAGRAFGWLRCAGERRWVWGAFAFTFALAGGARDVEVVAYGLGGVARARVVFRPLHDVRAPRVARARLGLRFGPYRAPRVRAAAELAR